MESDSPQVMLCDRSPDDSAPWRRSMKNRLGAEEPLVSPKNRKRGRRRMKRTENQGRLENSCNRLIHGEWKSSLHPILLVHSLRHTLEEDGRGPREFCGPMQPSAWSLQFTQMNTAAKNILTASPIPSSLNQAKLAGLPEQLIYFFNLACNAKFHHLNFFFLSYPSSCFPVCPSLHSQVTYHTNPAPPSFLCEWVLCLSSV